LPVPDENRPERTVRDNSTDELRRNNDITEWGTPHFDVLGRPYELFPDGSILYIIPEALAWRGGVDSEGRRYQIDYDGKPTYYDTLTGLPLNDDDKIPGA